MNFEQISETNFEINLQKDAKYFPSASTQSFINGYEIN